MEENSQENDDQGDDNYSDATGQGRVVYLGYHNSYDAAYRIEIDYINGSGTPSPIPFSALISPQKPGKVLEIDDFSSVKNVRLYDTLGGGLLAKYGPIVPGPGDCWQQAQMVDNGGNPVNYWIVWSPGAQVVVVMDDSISTA
jgi:hypothetical protein